MIRKDEEKDRMIEALKKDLISSQVAMDEQKEQQVEALTVELQSLKVEMEKLVNRSKDLDRRYNEGDLVCLISGSDCSKLMGSYRTRRKNVSSPI